VFRIETGSKFHAELNAVVTSEIKLNQIKSNGLLGTAALMLGYNNIEVMLISFISAVVTCEIKR